MQARLARCMLRSAGQNWAHSFWSRCSKQEVLVVGATKVDVVEILDSDDEVGPKAGRLRTGHESSKVRHLSSTACGRLRVCEFWFRALTARED